MTLLNKIDGFNRIRFSLTAGYFIYKTIRYDEKVAQSKHQNFSDLIHNLT